MSVAAGPEAEDGAAAFHTAIVHDRRAFGLLIYLWLPVETFYSLHTSTVPLERPTGVPPACARRTQTSHLRVHADRSGLEPGFTPARRHAWRWKWRSSVKAGGNNSQAQSICGYHSSPPMGTAFADDVRHPHSLQATRQEVLYRPRFHNRAPSVPRTTCRFQVLHQPFQKCTAESSSHR